MALPLPRVGPMRCRSVGVRQTMTRQPVVRNAARDLESAAPLKLLIAGVAGSSLPTGRVRAPHSPVVTLGFLDLSVWPVVVSMRPHAVSSPSNMASAYRQSAVVAMVEPSASMTA